MTVEEISGDDAQHSSEESDEQPDELPDEQPEACFRLASGRERSLPVPFSFLLVTSRCCRSAGRSKQAANYLRRWIGAYSLLVLAGISYRS